MIRLEQMDEEGGEVFEGNVQATTKKFFWRVFFAIIIIIGLVLLITTVFLSEKKHVVRDGDNVGIPSPVPTFIPTPIPTTVTPVGPKVRLVNGTVPSEGRVEILVNDTWGTVCGDNWEHRDAQVVCKSLGYPGARDAPLHAFFGQGTLPILLDDVDCQGDEVDIFSCRHPPFFTHDCLHSQDASAICLEAEDGDSCNSCSFLPIHFTSVSATILLLCDINDEIIWSPSVNASFNISGSIGNTVTVPIDVRNSTDEQVFFDLSITGRYPVSVRRNWGDICSVRLPDDTVSAKYIGTRTGEVSDIRSLITYTEAWEVSTTSEFPDFEGYFIILPKKIPATPPPLPLCRSEVLIEDAYLSGYALGDKNTYGIETAIKKCKEYQWGCGGVTCLTENSCTLRSDMYPKASGSSEYSCLKADTSEESKNGSQCISWRPAAYCSPDGDRDVFNDDDCFYPIKEMDSGFCQCGDNRVVPIRCGDFSKIANCTYACSLPPVNECLDANPCEGLPCVDASPSILNNVYCFCDHGLLGVGLNSPPECRSPFLPIAQVGCPLGLFSISSPTECRDALFDIISNQEVVIIEDHSMNGCVVTQDGFYWGNPQPATSGSGEFVIANITEVDTYTVCSTNELPGGLIPPPTDCIASSSDQVIAVYEVLDEIFPGVRSHFTISISSLLQPDQCSVSQLNEHSNIEVVASRGVSACKCIYEYLTLNGMSVSWGREGVTFSSEQVANFNKTPHNFTLISSVPYRYALNEVTFSYTTAWWDWERWRSHINWLALRGVTLPLAAVGQEFLWSLLYQELGLSDEDIAAHFGNPAYQAWVRMGNLEGFGGGVSNEFLRDRHNLQIQILQKMRALGMEPVLPGFAGHVPRGIEKVFPNSSFVEGGEWNGFSGSLFLHPSDELFPIISKRFIELQTDSYNCTNHWYSADSFNEMQPPEESTEYLQTASAAVLDGIKSGDKFGKWIIQGWLFTRRWWLQREHLIHTYLGSVPASELLVLDLNSVIDPVYERTESYFGHSYIWCLLHNFGGRNLLYGNFEEVHQSARNALADKQSGLTGLGITMEGLNQNEIIYDFALDLAWEGLVGETDDWLTKWVFSRYNSLDPLAGWIQLFKTVYHSSMEPPLNKWVLFGRPSLESKCSCLFCDRESPVHKGWALFLNCKDSLKDNLAWRNDLAKFTMLVLETEACRTIDKFVSLVDNYHIDDTDSIPLIEEVLEQVEEILLVMDDVLATDVDTKVACWFSDAVSRGLSDEEKSSFLTAAARLVTSWGPTAILNDYSKRHWSGLVGSYYRSRWRILKSEIREILVNDRDPNLSQTDFEQSWWDTLHPHNFTTVVGECRSTGDIVKIAEQVREKYYPEAT
eukprot:TRINITY_DN10998_c1_g1_i1.p1 TRINITY_DN10998_c1_g1~~TRINITY_DN10998_c1_g1_i1.p1  ORF type:complete len:1355 (+),score=254.51 TRINITY_DN10998_c1_g1_i1:39-4103(+)